MKHALLSPAVALLAVVSSNLTPAQAQPMEVFVAAQGSDTNPCTVAQPCLTFQHAHDTVAAGGVIDVLSPADYGVVTITKAISVQGHRFAGLVVTSGNGITINAGPNDKVSLRGLLIDGVGLGTVGIAFSTGASLDVQDCLIRNFTADGINFVINSTPDNPVTSSLFVSDTYVAANGSVGIRVANDVGAASGALHRVVSVGNGRDGLQFFLGPNSPVQFAVSDSAFLNNGVTGVTVYVRSAGQNVVNIMLRNVNASNNVGNGIWVLGGMNTFVWLTKSTITGNGVGLGVTCGTAGVINSMGDNSLFGNFSVGGSQPSGPPFNDGSPCVTIGLR
jgi:hypothetical protein